VNRTRGADNGQIPLHARFMLRAAAVRPTKAPDNSASSARQWTPAELLDAGQWRRAHYTWPRRRQSAHHLAWGLGCQVCFAKSAHSLDLRVPGRVLDLGI